jgi:hypothetical protein
MGFAGWELRRLRTGELAPGRGPKGAELRMLAFEDEQPIIAEVD